ncbi:hypothetical protein PMAYCL1PPCAC_01888, partial [Pristionchus mayeri]
AIKAGLPASVRAEIDNHKAELAHKIGLLTLDEIVDKLEKLADHIKSHPDIARARVAKMSTAAQKPFGDMIKIFCSDKTPKEKYEECQKIKAGLPASVRAEIDNHKTDLAHKIGLLTLDEIVERLEKLAAHIRSHPDQARAKVATLSTAAQKPFGEMIKIFCSDKTPKEKFEECRKIRDSLPSDVLGEINAVKEELSHKIGIAPLHHH